MNKTSEVIVVPANMSRELEATIQKLRRVATAFAAKNKRPAEASLCLCVDWFDGGDPSPHLRGATLAS